MAIISRQIGWGTESNLLYQILKQLNRLTSIMFGLKPKYKVYTALLTQSGGDLVVSIQVSPLVIGTTYTISDYIPNDDFTNVGAPSNQTGVSFVATGTTPNNWDKTSELTYNTGAPVVTVLENTIGDIWWTYEDEGTYRGNSNDLFTNLKSTAIVGTPYYLGNTLNPGLYTTEFFLENTLKLFTFTVDRNATDDYLDLTFIEIRIYN